MKKNIPYIVLLLMLLGLGYFLYVGLKYNSENAAKINASIDNFIKTRDYLLKNYNHKFPIPSGDVVLLDRKGQEIHLEDRNVPLSSIKNLYVIQGTTCDILKNYKQFSKINYDPRYSIIKGNKVLFKKCFSYSVTKNGKYFQIGTVQNGKAVLDGNINNKSITKAYDAPVLVKNQDTEFFPYLDEKVSPIIQAENLKNSDLKLIVEGETTKTKKIKNGNNIVLDDVDDEYDIKLVGKINFDAKIKFIDTNGNIVYIGGDKDGKVEFKIDNYKIDTQRINYVVETGKFIADILKLSPKKEMTVSKGGTTLVIRGTKFTVDVYKDSFDTFLSLGHIVQKIKNVKNIDITLDSSFTSILGGNITNNTSKFKKLVGYTVMNDIVTLPRYKFNIYQNSIVSGNILGKSDANINIVYENGEKITLLIYKIDKFKEQFIKYLNNDTNDILSYKNLINRICKNKKLGDALDVISLYYLLNVSDIKKNISFNFRSGINEKIDIKNYVLLTSRYGGVNGAKNYTSVVAYKSNNTIGDVSLARIFKGYSKYENIVVACEQ